MGNYDFTDLVEREQVQISHEIDTILIDNKLVTEFYLNVKDDKFHEDEAHLLEQKLNQKWYEYNAIRTSINLYAASKKAEYLDKIFRKDNED